MKPEQPSPLGFHILKFFSICVNCFLITWVIAHSRIFDTCLVRDSAETPSFYPLSNWEAENPKDNPFKSSTFCFWCFFVCNLDSVLPGF